MFRATLISTLGLAGVAATAGTTAFVIPGSLPHHDATAPIVLKSGRPEFVANTEDVPFVEAAALESSESWVTQVGRWLTLGVAAGFVAAACSTTPVEAYNTPILGKANWEHDVVKGNLSISSSRVKLEPCSKSKRFAKRIKDELYKLQQRQNKYPEGSVVYNRFVEQAALVKRRQNAYGDRLCGKKDGLPRVLADNAIKGGLTIPTLGFIYSTGAIGWAGRSYLLRTRSMTKEFYIDLPLALMCMASSFAWPVLGWQAIVNGEMAEKEENIYRQPW